MFFFGFNGMDRNRGDGNTSERLGGLKRRYFGRSEKCFKFQKASIFRLITVLISQTFRCK